MNLGSLAVSDMWRGNSECGELRWAADSSSAEFLRYADALRVRPDDAQLKAWLQGSWDTSDAGVKAVEQKFKNREAI